MKSVLVSSNNLAARVQCPASKSYTNRALITASLSGKKKSIVNPSHSQDTHYLVDGLRSLGCRIEKTPDAYEVDGIGEPEERIPFLGEGGTTIRFFIAFAAAIGRKATFEVHPRFLKRPIHEFQELLKELGVALEIRDHQLRVSGKLTGGMVEVDCAKTTQFASALELVSQHVGLKVVPVNVKSSSKYLYMTSFVKQKLAAEKSFHVPADFSSLSYFAVYACLTSVVTVVNATDVDPFQADAKVLDVIDRLGGRWTVGKEGLTIFPAEEFFPVTVDGSECLDAVPSLVFLFSYSGKRHVIKGLANLRHKESDRLEEIMKVMSAFSIGFAYDQEKDVLTIEGRGRGQGLKGYQAAVDHRMVMCASMFLKFNGGGEIAPAEAVSKSFPDFFLYFQ